MVPRLTPSALIRECVALVLAAMLVLSGLANARLDAAKAGDPGSIGGFTLCLPGNAQGSDDPANPDHDCADCCLPALLALPHRLAGLPERVAKPASGTPVVRARTPTAGPIGLPWSRGPPQAA